jgi:hypothetical protein
MAGLILDSSVPIRAERDRLKVEELLFKVRTPPMQKMSASLPSV